ncbi:tetratricopeptide repeat protein, partial [Bordetella bronchiseptica E013]
MSMDEGIAAAARALALGDALAALNRVALRDDAPALALRGIALAQLGDFDRARALVRRAARAFGPGNAVARARCALAEGEIALAARDLAWPGAALRAAQRTLATHGDPRNAVYAQYLEVRRLLLVGELARAAERLDRLADPAQPHDLRAIHDLLAAGLAMRQLRAGAARAALARAAQAARQAAIAPLAAEVARAARLLDAPVA